MVGMKAVLSSLLALITIVSASTAWAAALQCPASIAEISTADHVSPGDQCYFDNLPDSQSSAPRTTVAVFPVGGPAASSTAAYAPQNHGLMAATRRDAAIHGEPPAFLRTVALLI